MKWEYLIYRFFEHKELDTLAYRLEWFNKYGNEGWELVSIENEVAYFKRTIKDNGNYIDENFLRGFAKVG